MQDYSSKLHGWPRLVPLLAVTFIYNQTSEEENGKKSAQMIRRAQCYEGDYRCHVSDKSYDPPYVGQTFPCTLQQVCVHIGLEVGSQNTLHLSRPIYLFSILTAKERQCILWLPKPPFPLMGSDEALTRSKQVSWL